MTIAIRKIGNSFGLLIPKPFLNKLGLDEGQELDLIINESNEIVLKPIKKSRPKYKLSDLITQCDANAERDPQLQVWDNLKPVGKEEW